MHPRSPGTLGVAESDNEFLAELQRILQAPDLSIPEPVVNRMILSVLLNLDRRLRGVEAIAPVVRVMLWVGAAIGASIVGLIWSLITGQASIMFN